MSSSSARNSQRGADSASTPSCRPAWTLRRALVLAVGMLSASVLSAQTFTEFTVTTSGSGPGGITAGPDGNLWFTEEHANQIAKITPAGVITEFPIPGTDDVDPVGIVAGPDGNLWFTLYLGDQIGQITPAGVMTIFDLPFTGHGPLHIGLGPDGNLWFTQFLRNRIGRMTPAGTFTEFAIPTAGSEPDDITAGPDGNLWFVESAGNKIGRVTTAGVITEFPIPTPDSSPQGITAGPDGAMWFTEFDGNKIGRMTTAGVFTEFPVPITTANAGAHHICVGPDGNLWVPLKNANKIARVTPAGVITEFPVPTISSGPLDIAAGADGAMWFTESSGNKIGRITTGGCEPDGETLCLNQNRFRLQVAWRAVPLGTSGVGKAVRLTADTGYFWFFQSTNVELVIKILDARSFSGYFWVFYGALSNVEYTITVTDTLTAEVRTFFNPQNRQASVAHTSAFPLGGGASSPPEVSGMEEALDRERVAFGGMTGALSPRPEATSAVCVSSPTVLCLSGNRFRVEVTWRAAHLGTSGVGKAVPLTSDTGYFWFFQSTNVELVIKVLDARSFSGYFWVFYGALSNVEYTITVTDTETSEVKTYFNPQDTLASVADTAAF